VQLLVQVLVQVLVQEGPGSPGRTGAPAWGGGPHSPTALARLRGATRDSYGNQDP